MSTQKKNRMRPLMALLGGIVWMFSLFISPPARCTSIVSIQFNAQTPSPASETTPPPTPRPTPAQTAYPFPTTPPASLPTGGQANRTGGSGGSSRGGSAKEGAETSASATGSGAITGTAAAGTGNPDAPPGPEATARWLVYMKVDLLVGADFERVASVHMRAGTLDFAFANSKPDPSNTQLAQYQTVFSEDGRRILDFFATSDTQPSGTPLPWPDPTNAVPSAAELLHPHIRKSEPYYFDVTTMMVWD